MIKTITERSLHEVLKRMRAEGVSLKDTEGFGINVDQSGHIYVVYMDEEAETGVIDTSAGEAGMCAYINPNQDATDYSNQTIEIGIVESEVTIASAAEAITHSSGNSWTHTLAEAATGIYIKPNTVVVAASGDAPALKDDGLGSIVTSDHRLKKVGTVDYNTGAVAIAYPAKTAPLSTATINIGYKYSALPNTTVFPKMVNLSHIVFELSASAKTVSFSLYDNNPAISTPNVSSVFATTAASATYGGAEYVTEHFCDGRVSMNSNTLATDRQVRWMKMSASGGYIKAVYVYWNKLSS